MDGDVLEGILPAEIPPFLEGYTPLVTALGYYITVFIIAEFMRKSYMNAFGEMNIMRPNHPIYIFVMETIATTQMVACVFENGIIGKEYGYLGFFLVVTVLLYIGSLVNRGAFVNILPLLEAVVYGDLQIWNFLAYLVGQVLGGNMGWYLATQIWRMTYKSLKSHGMLAVAVHTCKLQYKVDFTTVTIFEIVGCFVIRLVLEHVPPFVRTKAIPMFISGMLTFALYYVGIPGLNPTIASSRLFLCAGMDLYWKISLYWVCPVIGWLAAAMLCRWGKNTVPKNIAPKAEKKQKLSMPERVAKHAEKSKKDKPAKKKSKQKKD